MITGINESITLTKHTSCKCKMYMMQENLTQINGGIMINVDVSVKNVMFGILVHVVVKTENIKQVLWMIQRLCVTKL